MALELYSSKQCETKKRARAGYKSKSVAFGLVGCVALRTKGKISSKNKAGCKSIFESQIKGSIL